MPDQRGYLSTTQKGAITEYAVATALMLGSGGRFSVFTPIADDHGVDLIIFDKETAVMMPVQVKSWTKAPSPAGTIQFDVQKTTFKENETSILIAIQFDPDEAKIKLSWLMTMKEVPEISSSSKNKYALAPSVRPESSDKYRRFRHDNLQSLVQAVVEKLEGVHKTEPGSR